MFFFNLYLYTHTNQAEILSNRGPNHRISAAPLRLTRSIAGLLKSLIRTTRYRTAVR